MWTKTYKVVGFLEPGVVRFGDKNLTIYISEKAIERYSYRLKGKPVTVGHIEGITEANAQQYSVGDVAMCTEPGECVVTIKNEEADRKIESGERFSCCWVPVRWGPGGTWHNIPYDKELVEMDFTHLAIVPDPRYENVEVYMNSKEFDNARVDNLLPDGGQSRRLENRFQKDKLEAMKPQQRTLNQNINLKRTYGDEHKGIVSSGTQQLRRETNQNITRFSQGPKRVKVSNFQNSLNPGQYAFLKKYVKEYNNAKVDEGLSPERKQAARMDRQATWTESGVHHAINYKANAGKNFMLRLSNPQDYKKVYNNEADPPDNSVERMDRINKYLQKREDRRIDKQYQTYEAPKQYNPDAKRFYNSNYKRKDGKEFNNNVFKEALKKWKSDRGESRIDSTRSLLTEQTGNMPHIAKGPKGAVGRISESKAQRLAQDL